MSLPEQIEAAARALNLQVIGSLNRERARQHAAIASQLFGLAYQLRKLEH